MIRIKLRNRFLKYRSDEIRRLFQKQRNKCGQHLQKANKEYFSSLNVNKVVDNKSFAKQLNHFSATRFLQKKLLVLVMNL